MSETCEARMEKTIASLKDSFNTIRTGRANAAIFDKVRVDYYGTKSPLNQVATIASSLLLTNHLFLKLKKQFKLLIWD